ncbi:MAG: 50S ribosomal protein L16 [Parcubacteria group bacterium]|nr:50S ribosomal protein L16 [Parcubacteria group bacterium]
MLFPKKVKHRKWQRGRKNPKKIGVATRGTAVSFGSYGLKSTTSGRINARQIESSRKTLTRIISKTGKIWIRIFPDRPYTKKAAEVGMGKGKGDVEGYEVEVLPGRVLFEVDGVKEDVARDVLRKAGAKLPIKTRVIARG